jgi:hypothetical protein
MKVYQDNVLFVDEKLRLPVHAFAFDVIRVGTKEFSTVKVSVAQPSISSNELVSNAQQQPKKRGRRNSNPLDLMNTRRSSRLKSDSNNSISSAIDVD